MRTDEILGFGIPLAYLYASLRVGRVRVEFEMALSIRDVLVRALVIRDRARPVYPG